ncbi:putative choline kinase 2 [Zea mays]|uniref:Putative choline kinase 2 n=1 Tax=Zea mays TaxID=4577 RepID=A0A1D6J891_MAIZE|nr:putative choline kinase 2 [Zea mays]AQK44135.1 putative choline kinase 2 [Zea mays]
MAAADPPPRGEAAPALKQSASIDRIPVDERRILHRLAGDLWGGDVDPGALAVSQLRGAMTNKGNDPHKVLVRIYGRGVEVFFDRADEVRTFECMSRHGQGPRLLGPLRQRPRRGVHQRQDPLRRGSARPDDVCRDPLLPSTPSSPPRSRDLLRSCHQRPPPPPLSSPSRLRSAAVIRCKAAINAHAPLRAATFPGSRALLRRHTFWSIAPAINALLPNLFRRFARISFDVLSS